MVKELTKEEKRTLDNLIAEFFKKNNIALGNEIDIVRFCNELGIRVVLLEFTRRDKDIDGLILVRRGEKKIGVSVDLTFYQARYIIAYELCHYIENERKGTFAFKDKLFCQDGGTAVDSELDYMATSILIPKSSILVYVDALEIKEKYTQNGVKEINPLIVELLSNKFQVENALIYRQIVNVCSNNLG